MRVGMMLNYSGGFTETVSELADFERAGLQIVFVPEAYSFDAVSQLGYIAARTTTVEIASGILPVKALLAGLDLPAFRPVLAAIRSTTTGSTSMRETIATWAREQGLTF